MKMKKYAMLAIVLLTSVLTICFAGRATPKTLQLEKDKKADSNLTALQELALSTKRVWANKKEVLQGLEGVYVLVESIQPEAQKYGLTKKDLQTDTELQLRQYGIGVLTFVEGLSTPGAPWLYINVNVAMSKEERVAGAVISVQLREDVLLLREPIRVCLAASTWQTGRVFGIGLLRIKEIREDVKDLVNEFINDYLAANPSKKPTASPPTTNAPQKGLVSAIVVSEDNPYIFINDYTIYYEGDTIDGVTVVNIYKDRVVFEKEGTEGTIRWTQKIGEAPKAHWE